MASRRPTILILLLVAIAAVAIACTGASGPLGSVPAVSASPEPSVAQGSPDITPAPSSDQSEGPSGQPTDEPTEPADSPSASTKPGSTTLVRAYFWLGGGQGSAGLVATLREVAGTKAVATAAVNALLAGPTSLEARNSISSAVPDGTQLLGLSIAGGVATVNLSSEFASGGDADAVQTRTGQVVYTLTQFPSVKSVVVQVEGVDPPKPLGRADFTALLPDIWVDRPAWNAAIGNPAHVTGSANVFEATFRISILDASGKTVADQQAMATCGSGCRGTFDVLVPYTVSRGQYGTLRVYDPSAQDGSQQSIRDYRVWLTPKA